MQRLGTGYVRDFNGRTGRSGHLYQGRYKSFLVADEVYLRLLVRYVHRNPIKHGLVRSLSELERDPWSGHGALMGRTPAPFQEVQAVLALFGDSVETARVALNRWMGEAGTAGAPESDGEWTSWRAGEGEESSPLPVELLKNAPPGEAALAVRGRPLHRDSAVHGRPEQICAGLEHLGHWGERGAERLRWGRDIPALAHWVCEQMAVDAAVVRSGRRGVGPARARAAVVWLGYELLGIPLTRLSPELGVGVAALSKAISRGEQACLEAGISLERWRDAQVDK